MIRPLLNRLTTLQRLSDRRRIVSRRLTEPDRPYVPQVRRLEPRFVLNATAELNLIGQLLVTGTASPESVLLNVDSNGDLQVLDGLGATIPIANHPDGAGFETNPLDPAAINAGEIRFDLQGGNDVLGIQLPAAIDINVIDGGGEDLTVLAFSDDRTLGDITVNSEQIQLGIPADTVAARDAMLDLTGNVTFGRFGQPSELDLGSGSLSISGQFTIVGDTTIRGDGANIDFSTATVTSFNNPNDLTFDLGPASNNRLQFGGTSNGIGALIKDLEFRSIGSVSLTGTPTILAGNFTIVDATNVEIESDIDTTGGNADGDIFIASSQTITTASMATLNAGGGSITIDGGQGSIDLSSSILQSDSPDDAVTIRNASTVNLGNIDAQNGRLTLGIDQDVSGDINQAAGTTLRIDRLAASTQGSLDLSNPGNTIQTVQQIDIEGDLAINNSADDLTVIDIDSRGRNVELKTPNRLLISSIDAGSAQVTIDAFTIDDAEDDSAVDIVGNIVSLTASAGIGQLRPLELLDVNVLTATSTTGDIVLEHQGDQPIDLRRVTTREGVIAINSSGTIRATDVSTINSGNIQLITSGQASDIEVSSIVAGGDSDVRLESGDDINLVARGTSLVQADDLQLLARNQTGDVDAAVELNTSVNQFQASVLGGNRGDLLLREIDSIELASSDAMGDEIVETENGQIVITAGEDIVITDHSLNDEDVNLGGDPEIVARGNVAQGNHGRVDLRAGSAIELGDDVQIHAERITNATEPPRSETDPPEIDLLPEDRAVYFQSNTISFGDQIEINTGPTQGVARFFAPVPVVEIDRSDPDHPKPAEPTDPDIVPAYFDPLTVDTNILEQAIVNDATGFLTIDIGRPGERGLTVDIDWGAASDESLAIGRFQRLNGISADSAIEFRFEVGIGTSEPTEQSDENGLLRVEHFYTQEEIVNSRENGRTAATDPLEVRFSVRHHESIFIQADRVSQQPVMEEFSVPGSVVSSTDNPLTPPEDPNGLENGQASFVIPPLSIPVAFFPVRDVIPVLETPQFVVNTETVIPLSEGTVETVEATVTSSVGREEYFQIRVLSPDPEGEDLVQPRRLPDDILAGNKIRQLFERLPDGQYQIDYVIGDGNERAILRVEIREGEATVTDEPLDAEGELKLRAIEGGQSEEKTEQNPNNNDSAGGFVPPETTAAAGLVFATSWKRKQRRRRHRLSSAARFAARQKNA